jgi:hypothetical protein
MTVTQEDVYGTYRTSYPFGVETITLNRDGTFVQQIAIKQEKSVTVSGTWDFDCRESRAILYGCMVVSDGLGNLKRSWPSAKTKAFSFVIEKRWFKIVMGASLAYPYVK